MHAKYNERMSCDGDCIILSSDDETVVIEQPETVKMSVSSLQTEKSGELDGVSEVKYLGNGKFNDTNNEASTKKENEPGTSSKCDDNKNKKVTPSKMFQQLTNKLLSMEEKKEDKTRILKKLTKYHDLANKEYLSSQEFNGLMVQWMEYLEKDSSSLYLVLKEVLDCLSLKRMIIGLSKKQIDLNPGEFRAEKSDNENDVGEEFAVFYGNDENYKAVKKLNKALKKLGKKIQELENEEVDLIDEENSVYVRLQRYRERFCQIYKKICSYTGQNPDAKRLYTRKIFFSGTKNLEVNQSIEKWLNKTKQFPDFVDVLKFIEELNNTRSLGLSKTQSRDMAEEVFKKIGMMLQQRRAYDLWDSFCFYLDAEEDPALKEPDLETKLRKNSEVGTKKMNEVFNYYVEKQISDRLEAVEVPDDEANRSPVESGDEDEKEIEKAEEMLALDTSDVEDEDEDTEDEKNEEREILGTNHVNTREPNTRELEDGCKPEKPASDLTDLTVEKEKVHGQVENLKRRGGDESEETSVKKKKIDTITRVGDDESDCDVVVLTENGEDRKDCFVSPKKKFLGTNSKIVHHINYAFMNNHFNYVSYLSVDSVFSWPEKVRSLKKDRRQQKSIYQDPLSDLTYLKGRRKVPRPKCDRDDKRTAEQVVKKYIYSQFFRHRPCDRPRVKHTSPFVPNKMIVQSALKNKKENVNSGSEKGEIGKDYSDRSGSGESGGNPTNGGGLGGGNGQDNNEDDRDKKPASQREKTNQSTEDEEEKDESADEKKQSGEEQAEEVLQIVSTPDIDPELFGDKSPNGFGFHDMDDEEERKDETSHDGIHHVVDVDIDPDVVEYMEAISRPSFSNNERSRRRGGRGMGARRRGSRNVFPRNANSLTGREEPSFSRTGASSCLLEAGTAGARIPERKGALRRVWSDEEIVRNFLQRSPPSITITTPRRKAPEKSAPSPSVVQAMETLSRLKGISLTLVKGKRKETDGVVVGENSRGGGRPSDFPIPKIVTVQGNVPGFEDIPERGRGTASKRRGSPMRGPSSRRRVSASGTSSEAAPAPRFRNTHPRTSIQRGGSSLWTTAKDGCGGDSSSSSNCVIID